MTSPETGAPLKRGVRPFRVTYKGQSITVDLLDPEAEAAAGAEEPGYDRIYPRSSGAD